MPLPRNQPIGFLTALLATLAPPAPAAPPVIYSQPYYQSPVHGEPDDLLLLAGNGFAAGDVVVYRALSETGEDLTPPDSIPDGSTMSDGTADVVSMANVPDSLTVRLPTAMEAERAYALWVRNRAGEWSNGARINDARPLWLSPAYVYATDAVARLPRTLKIVGRNLQPAAGQVTRIRLSGPERLTLTAAPGGSAVDHYVAEAALPAALPPGSYSVEVSRDGNDWIALAGQQLEVRPDRPTSSRFAVSAYGCRADDDRDDVPCVLQAIAAAHAAGGGAVFFGPGRWLLRDGSAKAGLDATDGIVVPSGVSLIGAGAETSVVEFGKDWSAMGGSVSAAFALLGDNTVSGLSFRDARVYRATEGGAMLRIGKTWLHVRPDEAGPISDIVISHNVFDKPYDAIVAGGLPIRHLFITFNEFGAYHAALELGGDRYNFSYPFRVDDAVVSHNIFRPGSYIDRTIGQGTMASEIGASRRLDFSDNVADGTSADFLYSPADAPGWRAAFFWHMNNNQEMVLVARNAITCAGDKAGDGEAIAFDNNANTPAFDSARTVLRATADTVTVDGPLLRRQNGKDIAERLASYYGEHWIQVAQGPGLGQVRRVAGYSLDATTGQVTFTVAPAWDVPPRAHESRVTAARQFWQVYAVDNVSDQRNPPCHKANANGPKGGSIAVWAQTADSVVEGNRLYDTSGIALQQAYSAAVPPGNACGTEGCSAGTSFLAFVEFRGNVIDGEYDWRSDCSQSGIFGSHSASPAPGSPPPVAGYGVSIAHNTIRHADGLRGGAITLPLTWYGGPSPGRWDLIDNTLIHHNVIVDLIDPVPNRRCDARQSHRLGINIADPLVWRTVLYDNTCSRVAKPLNDSGTGTVRVCPDAPPAESCECGRNRPGGLS